MRRGAIVPAVAAVLVLVAASPAGAATKDVSIVGVSQGFSPKAVTASFGDTVRWTNNDSIDHTTTQNGPLALWDSGHLSGGDTFSFSLTAAGSYPYHCNIHPSYMKGTVKVPIEFGPSQTGTIIVVIASQNAAGGFVYDVQRRKGSGDWKLWKSGITSSSVSFKPKSSGTWSFRARLRRTSDDAASKWSPARSASV